MAAPGKPISILDSKGAKPPSPPPATSTWQGRKCCASSCSGDALVVVTLFLSAAAVLAVVYTHVNMDLQMKVIVGGSVGGGLVLLSSACYFFDCSTNPVARVKTATKMVVRTKEEVDAAVAQHFRRKAAEKSKPGEWRRPAPAPRKDEKKAVPPPEELYPRGRFAGIEELVEFVCNYDRHIHCRRNRMDPKDNLTREEVWKDPSQVGFFPITEVRYSKENDEPYYFVKIMKRKEGAESYVDASWTAAPIGIFKFKGKWVCETQDKELLEYLKVHHRYKHPRTGHKELQRYVEATQAPQASRPEIIYEDGKRYLILQDEDGTWHMQTIQKLQTLLPRNPPFEGRQLPLSEKPRKKKNDPPVRKYTTHYYKLR